MRHLGEGKVTKTIDRKTYKTFSRASWDRVEDYLQQRHKSNELQRISRGTRSTDNKDIPLEKSYNRKTTKQLYPWECEFKKWFFVYISMGYNGRLVRERIEEGGKLHSRFTVWPCRDLEVAWRVVRKSEMTKSLCFTAFEKTVPVQAP